MITNLPPLSSLLAFDAAARHCSFTKAAKELYISQPAVSRRVATLENNLNLKLFDRSTKPMSLTAEGIELFGVLRSSLSRLETHISDMRARTQQQKFTIVAFAGFLTYWLIPRLPQLHTAFPDIDLRIMTADYDSDLSDGDIHVRFGDGNWPGFESKIVISERVYAVCSPQYIGKRKLPLTLKTLTQERLLQMSKNAGRWFDWDSWFEKVDNKQYHLKNTIEIDSYSMIISAALTGGGIALCWDGLLDPLVSNGALIRVSEDMAVSNEGYFATYKKGTTDEMLAKKVVDWLCNSQ